MLFNASNIMPLCLPGDTSNSHVNKEATVVGWGISVEAIAGGPETPRHANLNVISNTMCQLMHPRAIIKR